MISNPSFETWFAPWNFRNDLGATFSQDSTTGANGTHASLKVAMPSSNSSQPWLVSVSQGNKTLKAGQSYTLSFWAKASYNRPIRAVIQNQNSPYTEYTSQAANVTTSWNRYTFSFSSPASLSTAMLNFNLASNNGTVWLDEVSLCPAGTTCSSSAAPAPTATQPQPTATQAQPTATRVAPTATQVQPTATKLPPTATQQPPTATPAPVTTSSNMISNASFDASVSPWYAPWNIRNDLGATFMQDWGSTANGSPASLKVVMPSGDSNQPWRVAMSQGNKSLVGGHSYTVTFWAKASFNRQMRMVVQNQNSPYTEFTNQAVGLGTGWVKYTLSFTAPSTLSTAMLNFNLADTNGTVWLDEVSMCPAGTTCK